MRSPYTQLYVHLARATWDRLPLLTETVEPVVRRCLIGVAVDSAAEVVAVGGVEDHVHLLLRIPTTISVAELVQRLKGASSRVVTDRLGEPFRWQGGYGACSVSPRHLPAVRRHVRRQKEHHREGRLHDTWAPPTPSARP